MSSKQKRFALLRIAFGVVWAIDAVLKWQPAFIGNFTSYLSSMVQGQPLLEQKWIGLWLSLVNVSPHFFAVLVASVETLIALGLILGLFTDVVVVGGAVFSLVLWTTAEGLGGPYMSGATDIGAAIIYVLVFIALWIGNSSEAYSLDALMYKKKILSAGASVSESQRAKGAVKNSQSLLVKVLFAAVIILGFTVAGFYFPAQLAPLSSMGANSAGMGAMPDGMTLATYDLQPSDPVPTVDFTVIKDPVGGGWNLHIITTNFTFTPQNENQAPVADQGHAHLYIDGVLSVVYGPWYHFNDLTPGEHTIAVSLNANNHAVFALNGTYIKKEETITQ